jgi:hypothetical protein
LEFARTRLDLVTEDEWKTALRSGVEPLPISKMIVSTGHEPLTKSRSLALALRGLIAGILSNSDQGARVRWFDAIELVSNIERGEILKSLTDQICNGMTVASALELLSAKDGLLLSQQRFVERAGDALLYIITPLLSGRENLVWLIANATVVRRWVERSSDDAKLRIRSSIAEWQADADEAVTASLAELLSALGLPEAPPTDPQDGGPENLASTVR